jgi:hypothetical protein
LPNRASPRSDKKIPSAFICRDNWERPGSQRERLRCDRALRTAAILCPQEALERIIKDEDFSQRQRWSELPVSDSALLVPLLPRKSRRWVWCFPILTCRN